MDYTTYRNRYGARAMFRDADDGDIVRHFITSHCRGFSWMRMVRRAWGRTILADGGCLIRRAGRYHPYTVRVRRTVTAADVLAALPTT